jgi:hypothetical protein
MPLSCETRLGPYQILAPIGAGGMGEVYRGRDSQLDGDVAVKVLPGHLANDTEAFLRFEREAKTVAALNHPNILAIHDSGVVRLLALASALAISEQAASHRHAPAYGRERRRGLGEPRSLRRAAATGEVAGTERMLHRRRRHRMAGYAAPHTCGAAG